MASNKKKIVAIVVGGIVILTLSGIVTTKSNLFIKETKNPVIDTSIVTNTKTAPTEKEIKKEDLAKETKQEIINNPSIPNPNSSLTKEEQAIEYFVIMESEVEEHTKKGSLKSSVTGAFIDINDFIFYGGEIKGVTYDQLSDSAKLQVLKIASRVDTTISSKWPTYKEDISTTTGKAYNTTAKKISEGIGYLDQKIENTVGTDPYNELKEGAGNATNEIKDVAGDIYDAGKEQATKAKEKIKTWYEGFREKNKTE